MQKFDAKKSNTNPVKPQAKPVVPQINETKKKLNVK